MNPFAAQKSRLLLPLTLGLCLGLGLAALAWSLHLGIQGRLAREMRGRALVSEDGALNVIGQASGKGHTQKDKEWAVAQIKLRGCPFPDAPHALWVLNEQDKILLACSGKNVLPEHEKSEAGEPRTGPVGMLGREDAADLLSRIRKEGIARHPPIHPREMEAEHYPPHQLTGRMFEPWRWVVGTTLNIERVRAQGQQYQRWAVMAGGGGAGLAALCLLGLALLTRRRRP